MLFDKGKIQQIETIISEMFQSFPNDTRCAKIVHSPCFNNLFLEARVRNFFHKSYTVFSTKQILESSPVKKEKTLSQKIVEKIISTTIGFIPFIGTYISLISLLAEITKDIFDEKNINDIEKYLNRKWRKHKKYRKLKYIIYVQDIAMLSRQEVRCLQIFSFLISQKYINNAAILVIQSSDHELPYLHNVVKLKGSKLKIFCVTKSMRVRHQCVII